MEKNPIVEQCTGCGEVLEDGTCRCYIAPKSKWSGLYTCPRASHREKEIKEKVKLNPMKAAKRARAGK